MERDANAKCNEAVPRCVEKKMLVIAKDFWSRMNDVAPSTLFLNLLHWLHVHVWTHVKLAEWDRASLDTISTCAQFTAPR